MLQENMCGQMLVVFSHAFFNQMKFIFAKENLVVFLWTG